MERMEKLLAAFINDCDHRKIPVGLKHIQSKALKLYIGAKNRLEDKTQKEIDETFVASNGMY